MPKETLTVTDNRTGESYEVPINRGAIRASDLVGRYSTAVGPELVIYDPGLANTAACASGVTNIHLQQGVLEHRGYRIEDLAEHASFTEVAYLLLHGDLPTPAQLARWESEIATRKFVHENVKSFIAGFRYDAAPMGIVAAAVGALGSFYPDAGDIFGEQAREAQILRLLAKMPTLAAYAYRHGSGRPYVNPSDDLSYTGNLLSMIFKMSELRYSVDPEVERALEVLLIVHADHEQSAATTAVRAVGSNHSDPYAAVAAGLYALSGPMRGAADLQALQMLRTIGSVSAVDAYLETVKTGEGRLMGFGHPIYRAADPRAQIVRHHLDILSEHAPASPLLAVADALAERTAEDEYFVSRGIHINAGLYTGLLYQAIGIPDEIIGVIFAVARSAGFLAQWLEMVKDPEQVTLRPRQLYVGPGPRTFTPLSAR
ncbi:citrate/2-methylcitrate synthase [Conexibacter sp. DBS9H8]|uniref:citrate/2-methylcitrate synthase n=1 Tax=Conexibacter sp. DBS9H8 TaxID=2937801 RepID=UPI00200F5D86|nr:citrate/2-methylcitrate synthase [Conexibacter sp. DBS9H8]